MTARDPPTPHCRTPRIMVFQSYRSALFTPFATLLGCSATSCSRPMQAPSRCCCALVAGYARSLTRAIAFVVDRPVICQAELITAMAAAALGSTVIAVACTLELS
jgi:hypothetical protein